MSVLVGQERSLLNFVITGEVRSGVAVVQSTVSNRPGTVCHGELFHPIEKVRKEAHESYFGRSQAKKPDKLPEWLKEGLTNPVQYINHAVLDNPQRGESHVGFRILYQEVQKWELWELFEARCREGDFCLVHVIRNPVACFVSLKQAERSGVWQQSWSTSQRGSFPGALSLDVAELTEFCRAHVAMQWKIKACCNDALEIHYQDIFIDYQSTMRKVFAFLELPDCDEPASAQCKRLRNRCIQDRIGNFGVLVREAPHDIRKFLEAEDLF